MSASPSHPYTPFLHRVKRPAQYVGGEHGEKKKDWAAARAKMCLAFPDLYEIGMSHLGFKILYGILNADDALLAERAYAPWHDMERELRAHGEALRSLESARPLSDFDVVGFSLQFELTYTNVLLMLDLGGVPLRSADRDDSHPLVVAGGPTATHPEPLAPFIDAFLIGDGERATPELLETWANLRDRGVPRAERLRHLAALPGWYVPSLYATERDAATGFHVVARPSDPTVPFPIARTFLDSLADYPFPADGPVATTETIFDRVSVEIARGCTEGCRFCQAGMIYRPVREREPEDILRAIDTAVTEGGYDEASLTSLSTADYSAIAPLVSEVMKRTEPARVSLSVSSLRAYGLSEPVLDEMQKTRATGLTFAPEAGTQRMRDVVNKNVTEAQLMETAERVFSRGWEKMKLYFMIGLPTEEDDDVRGIVETGAKAQYVGKRATGRWPRVTVSVSTHVPKPHTPFQWCAMDRHDEVVRKQAVLKDAAKKTRVQLRMHDSVGSWLEGVLARGDRSLADVVETAYRRGARFDTWDDSLKLDVWREAFEAHAIVPETFLGTIPVTARLPWDHIDVGLEDGFLAREYRKALKNRLSPPCGKIAGQSVHATNVADAEAETRRLVCYDCGIACDLHAMRRERVEKLVTLGAHVPKAPRMTSPVTLAAPPAPAPDASTPGASTPEASTPGASTGETVARASAEGVTPEHRSDDVRAVRTAASSTDASAEWLAASPTTSTEAGGPREVPRPKRPDRRPLHKVDQGESVRCRVVFEKVGRAAYASHLDLVRLLPRAFRRAELPLYYSQGFHPKPEMSFGPALPVAVAGLAEVVDVKLRAGVSPLDDASLRARLREVSQDGVRFVDARLLGPGDAGVSRVTSGGVYVAALAEKALRASELDEAGIEARIASRLGTKLIVRRVIEGIGKDVDVGRYLLDAGVGGGDVLGRAGIVGDFVPLTFTLRISGQGAAKPSEVLEALFGEAAREALVVRAQLFADRDGERVSLMELERLRAKPDARGAGAESEAAEPPLALETWRVDPMSAAGAASHREELA